MPLLPRTYFPLLAQYLWMKIDFVAMVQLADVDDPEALAAAEQLAQEGKTYLVHIRFNDEPVVRWDEVSGFSVDIVARGPRLVDNIRGFASDMYIPVHPFTHPRHPSLCPERALPFPDCSHWLGSEVDVFVARASEPLDNNQAHELPLIQVPLIRKAYAKEWSRVVVKGRKTLAGVPDSSSGHSAPMASGSCGPSSSATHDVSSAPNAPHSGRPQALEDDPYIETFIPLVNVGVDIAQRFAGSDKLPTIYDFFEERGKIKQILNATLERCAAMSSESPGHEVTQTS